jgi:7,8-dihydro-6-hydroxymethylpterin-pyrophosphokinase
VRASPRLTLPHPRLRARRFVLAPLADVAPDLPLPPDGETAARLLARLPAGPRVERLAPAGAAP